jgi:hypothetical protein
MPLNAQIFLSYYDRFNFYGDDPESFHCNLEEFLEYLLPEEQEQFLFHLDIFTGKHQPDST